MHQLLTIFFLVIPAQAGTRNPGLWNMDSRLRGNDGKKYGTAGDGYGVA